MVWPLYFFAAAIAVAAIGSAAVELVEATSAAFACAAAMKNGPAAAAAAVIFAALRSSSRRSRGTSNSSGSTPESSVSSATSSSSLTARCMTNRDHRVSALPSQATARDVAGPRPTSSDRCSGARVEEADRSRGDRNLGPLAVRHLRPDAEPPDERGPPHPPLAVEIVQQHGLVHFLGQLPQIVRDDRCSLDLEVDDHLGAQRLAETHLPDEPPAGPAVRGERRILEVLGSNAEDQRAPDVIAEALDGRRLQLVDREALRADDDRVPTVLPVQAALEEVHGRAADEPGNEDICRVVVEVLRARDLLELALSHHGD